MCERDLRPLVVQERSLPYIFISGQMQQVGIFGAENNRKLTTEIFRDIFPASFVSERMTNVSVRGGRNPLFLQSVSFPNCLSEPEHLTTLNVNFIFKDTFSLNSLHLICSPGLKAPVGSGEWEGPGAYLSHSKISTTGFSHPPTGVSLMLLVEGLS